MLKSERLYNAVDGKGAEPSSFLTKPMLVPTAQGGLRWRQPPRCPSPVATDCEAPAQLQRCLGKLSNQCQIKGRYNSQDLTKESVTKNKHQGVVFLKLGFGREIKKVTLHCLQKLPPLGFAFPELPAFSAPGILTAR